MYRSRPGRAQTTPSVAGPVARRPDFAAAIGQARGGAPFQHHTPPDAITGAGAASVRGAAAGLSASNVDRVGSWPPRDYVRARASGISVTTPQRSGAGA